jgi:CBS domain containing-hemolysin-like protein
MPDLAQQLLLQLILILLNAFFAATEIAIISLNATKVRARAEEGDKKAVKMLKMIEEPTGFLSTIQVGITLAGFLGSAFAADNFAEKLTDLLVRSFDIAPAHVSAIDSVSVVIITLILSYFTLAIVLDIWFYQITERVEEALDKCNIKYEFSTSDFWTYYILGSFVLVGPFIYMHKLCTAMNLLCEHYNNENNL